MDDIDLNDLKDPDKRAKLKSHLTLEKKILEQKLQNVNCALSAVECFTFVPYRQETPL